jgi:hypothetical protein
MRRIGRSAWSLPVSLFVHALAGTFLLHQHRMPHELARGESLLEIELRRQGGASSPAAAATEAAATAARAPGLRMRTRTAPPSHRQAPVAALSVVRPTAIVGHRNELRLQLRIPITPPPSQLSLRLSGRASGLAGGGFGIPADPIPNVIHHPVGKPVQGVRTTETGLEARVSADGSLTFSDPPMIGRFRPEFQPGAVGIGGTFDLNDMLPRRAGSDSYAYEKRKISEATFEERLSLARQAGLRLQREALFELKGRLERLHRLPGLGNAGRRRELVFEMWDECIDDEADGDLNLGAAARATLLAFIRRAFPEGSSEAYTPTELTALNKRRTSRALFDPYGIPVPMPDAWRPGEATAAQSSPSPSVGQ